MAENIKNWWVYLLRMGNGALYCGVTTDVPRRFAEHSSGGKKAAKALKNKGDLELVFTYCAASKQQAMQLEWRIKQWPKSQKECLVAGQFGLDEWLANQDGGK